MSEEMRENSAEHAPMSGPAPMGPVNPPVSMAPNCSNGQLYTIKSGDTLFFIAKRFNVSLQDLIHANPQIPDPNMIFPGQVICIPAGRVALTGCPNGVTYTVRSGDTMYEIAQRYNISLAALIAANPQISDPNLIFPGQTLCVPGGEIVSCPGGQIYKVVKGDSLFTIAQRFGVTLDALIRANPQIKNPDLIFPGQDVCIPTAPTPVSCPNGTLYTVRSGDTLWDISNRNNISLSALVAANPQIPDPNLIFPGQTICIPGAPIPMPAPMPMPSPVPIPIPMPMPVPTIRTPSAPTASTAS